MYVPLSTVGLLERYITYNAYVHTSTDGLLERVPALHVADEDQGVRQQAEAGAQDDF
jgi:hypothetical protein